MYVNVLFDNRR